MSLTSLFKKGDGTKSASEIQQKNRENARSMHKVARLINTTIAKLDGYFGKQFKKVNTSARYTDTNGDVVQNRTGTAAYVGKIRMPPKNEWRYYYSDEAFERAVATYNYRKADDQYMNNFDTIYNGGRTALSTKQAGDTVNPGHKKEGEYRNINCIYCTLATELRMRGYDVQAKDIPSVDNRYTLDSMFGLTRDSKRQTVSMDVDPSYTKSAHQNEIKNGKATANVAVCNNDHIQDVVPAMLDTTGKITDDNPIGINPKLVATRMQKQIESAFPPGSRGNFSIYWNGGGGHSEMWEIDKNGELHIWDTQAGTEMNEDSLEKLVACADPLQAIEFLRFDDCAIVDPTIIKDSIEAADKSK
jgi:hypothetical protein